MAEKKIKHSSKSEQSVEMPGQGVITLGPGTVPTSQTSAPTTNMSEVISSYRNAIIGGVFNKEGSNESSCLPNSQE